MSRQTGTLSPWLSPLPAEPPPPEPPPAEPSGPTGAGSPAYGCARNWGAKPTTSGLSPASPPIVGPLIESIHLSSGRSLTAPPPPMVLARPSCHHTPRRRAGPITRSRPVPHRLGSGLRGAPLLVGLVVGHLGHLLDHVRSLLDDLALLAPLLGVLLSVGAEPVRLELLDGLVGVVLDVGQRPVVLVELSDHLDDDRDIHALFNGHSSTSLCPGSSRLSRPTSASAGWPAAWRSDPSPRGSERTG